MEVVMPVVEAKVELLIGIDHIGRETSPLWVLIELWIEEASCCVDEQAIAGPRQKFSSLISA